MKLHKLYFSFLFLLVTTIFYAQNGIAYQAVIFKPGVKSLPGVSASSTPLANTKVCLRFTFNDISDKSEYQETVTVTTDDYGIVNTTIGLGNQIGGYAKNFSEVSWRTEQKTLVVELDLTANCSTYEEISRQSFSSTPFAFTANNISGIASIANGGTGASTAAEALDNLGAQRVSNLSTDINGDGASIVKYPAVKTVKEYVDNELKNVVINATPDATAVSKGKIQLAGDLSGTAALPTVPGLALKENGANKSQNIAVDGTSELKFPSVKAVKNYIDNQVTTAGDPLIKIGNVITISPATATVNGYLTKEDFNTFSNKIGSSEKAANNGVATLGNDGRIPSNQIPSISFQSANVVTSESDMLAISGAQVGSIAIRTDVNKNYVLSTLPASIFGNWLELSTPTAVTSVNGNSGPNVSLTKTDINLGNVENTKDIDKPISTSTQTALNLKAPLDSPAFTGAPLAPTADVNDSSAKLATTSFVTRAVASAVVTSTTPDATTSSTGKIQLAGDLAGTNSSATSPKISNSAVTTEKIADGAITDSKVATGISASKVGLGNVDNTRDKDKPVSAATKTALDSKLDNDKVGVKFGVATLDEKGTIPTSQIPPISFTSVGVVNSESEMLGLKAIVGSVAIRTDNDKNYILASNDPSQLVNWLELRSKPQEVLSVNSQVGSVVLTKKNIDLGNVENTKDIDKPISTLTQTALNLKAPLDSPAFTGTPLAPTAPVNDNSTKLATTAFVTTAVASVVGTATATPDATTGVLGKIQLAGDLAGTATAPEIGLNKVTFAKMQKVDTNTLLGRSTSGNGEIEALTTLPVATLPALTGDITTTAGSVATSIADKAVTLGKIKDLSGSSKLLGTLSTGVAVSEITLGTGLTMTNGTLNATGGTVTTVTGTTDRISVTNGGTTPVVDIASGYVGQSSITTLGTITTGTWNGTAIDVAHGGTGASTLTGYVKGTGTTAMTASANIPVTDVTGAQTVDNLSTSFTTDATSESKYPAVKTVKEYVDTKIAAVQAGGVSAADSTTKGIIKLGGDLAGTGSIADAPVISDLAITTAKLAETSITTSKLADNAVTSAKIVNATIIAEDIADGVITTNKISGAIAIANGGTGASTASGALTNLGAEAVANKATATDMGGSNADNTNYPTQLAVKTFVTDKFNEAAGTRIQEALNLKEDKTNKSTLTTLGTSDELYPSQKAVKTYVDDNLAKINAISKLESLPSIANNTILGNTSGGTSTPQAISITGTGDVVMKTDAIIDTPTITSPELNGTISGTAIVPIAQGGSGVDMSGTKGYLKQATTGENFSTVSSIPVSDVTGAVKTVNGVVPDNTTGNVVVAIGNVATGIDSTPPTLMGTNTLVASDIYIIAGQPGTVNDNGRTYIYDGLKWQEITSNLASTDSRYVKLSGSTMQGDLSFPAGKKITIDDAPTGSTDVANKDYVDATIVAATPDATTTVLGKIQLSGDLSGTATAPEIGLNKVTFAKMQKVDTNTLLGRSTSGNGEIEALTTLPVATLPALTGDITTTAGSVATSIADKAVTLGKIKDLSASSKLLGTLSTGVAVSEITLGTGLTMTNGTLNATGGTVTTVTGTTDRISVTNGGTTPVVDIASGYVGQTSITTLGTITTGTWNGTAIDVAHGGTGASTLTGYVKGTGTTAMTASANIPVTDVTGAQTVDNLSTSFTTDATSESKYPAVKTVKEYVDTKIAAVQAGGVSAADSTTKGIIKLGGDLAGTGSIADAPVISDLAITTAKLAETSITTSKLADNAVTSAKIVNATIIAEDIADGVITTNKISGAIAIANGGTGASTASGALTNLGAEAVANKATATDMGGSNADNTNYPTQLAVKTFVTDKFNEAAGTKIQEALNLKEDKNNKSTSTTLGTSDELYPSQKAVKTYVDDNLAKINAISSLTSLPSIANNTILGNTSGGTSTPQAISITGTGDVVMKTDAIIDTPTITSPELNGTISGTAIVPIAQGGSGVDMSGTKGYLKQATTGENFSTVSSIPVSDVTGAVKTVNGVVPDNTTGNVVVAIGNVATGIDSTPPTLMGTNTLVASDIYIIAGQPGTVNDNGRTYIYDGLKWQEITSNLASTDSRYVKLSGSTMQGDLSFPAGKKITIDDAPTGSTDVANKDYVDATIVAATPDATTTVLGKIQLSGDLSGTATAPEIGLNKVTFAKMQKVDTNTLLGRSTSGNGEIEALTTLPVATLPALTGDITTTAGSVATSIADKAVTLGKIKDLSASSKLLGTLSTGVAVSEITLGTGLTMTNGTLNATGGTVTTVTGTTDRISVTNGGTTPVVDIASGYVGQTSITTLGTITTGTWNGTAIDVAHGGTGASTLTGYVKGTGTTAMTASANIPVTDVTGAQTVDNLSTSFTTDATSESKYPAVKTVKDYIDTSVSSGVTNINTDIITGNYNVLTTDYTLLCDASTGFTLTLPAANTVKGKVYIIRKIDETENALTFSPEIAVSTTTNISNLNFSKTIRVQSNGTKWYLID